MSPAAVAIFHVQPCVLSNPGTAPFTSGPVEASDQRLMLGLLSALNAVRSSTPVAEIKSQVETVPAVPVSPTICQS